MTNPRKRDLKPAERLKLLQTLQRRFENHLGRHQGLEWTRIQAKLEANPQKLWSLNEMENSGGEPDVVAYDRQRDEYTFYDCSVETPKKRTSLCYDREALDSRKQHKPRNSAVAMAESMGLELLTEEQYRDLQRLGEFDTKTSSWVKTPQEIRQLGGALFCHRRFGRVFVFHNGADSYFGARGFRTVLRV